MTKLVKENKIKIIVISVTAFLIVVLSLIKRSVWICEYIFARGIARIYQVIIGNITSLLPFSLFELMIIAAIVLGIIFIFLMVRRIIVKDWNKLFKGILKLISVALIVILLYIVTASMNYNRAPMILKTYQGEVIKEDVADIAYYFLNDFNYLATSFQRDENGNVISPYSDRELAKIMREEFKRLNSSYFYSFTPLGKSIIFSDFMCYNRVIGVSFNLTAEPNINRKVPCYDKPYTMAHEIAHSIGIMRESDANLIAAYITLTSANDFVRYSGYFNTMGNIASMLIFMYGHQSPTYIDFSNSYHENIHHDYSFYSDFWSEYDTFVDRISSFVNDLYLKLQGVKEGTDSYNIPYEYEIIDSGERNEYGDTLFDIELSLVQRIYFDIYYNRK